MRKLFTVLAIGLMIMSCAKDSCTQEVQVFKKINQTSSRNTQETIFITKDTVFTGDVNADFLRFNGPYLATVKGDLDVSNFVLMQGGTLITEGDAEVGSNLFFNEKGGKFISYKSIDVGGHIVATEPTGGVKPILQYCDDLDYQILDDEWVEVIQDCTLDIEVPSGLTYIGITEKPCNFDFENQNDSEYYYVDLN